MTTEQIDRLEQIAREIEDGATLSHYAAGAALRVPFQNWRDALRDGYTLETLLPDIELVVSRLREAAPLVLK